MQRVASARYSQGSWGRPTRSVLRRPDQAQRSFGVAVDLIAEGNGLCKAGVRLREFQGPTNKTIQAARRSRATSCALRGGNNGFYLSHSKSVRDKNSDCHAWKCTI